MVKLDRKNGKIIVDMEKVDEYIINREISAIDDFLTLFFKQDYIYKTEFNYNKKNATIYEIIIKIGIKSTKEMMEIKYHLTGQKKGFEIINSTLNIVSQAGLKNSNLTKVFYKELKNIIFKETKIYMENIEKNVDFN